MRILVREPERDELRIQAESLGLHIRDAGEMLEAYERDTTSTDHQLASVRGADADHEHDVDIDIRREQRRAALLGITRQCDDVRALEHRAQVAAISVNGCV